MSPDSHHPNAKAATALDTLLVVEASRLVRDAIAKACKRRHVTLRSQAEVGAAISSMAEQRPTGILTAVELPGLSGVALAAAIKSCPRHRAIPVGLLTSKETVAGIAGAFAPDVVIHTNVHRVEAVAEFMGKFGIGVDATSAASPTQPTKLDGRILLAEDATTIQALLGKFLHVAGAEVVVVENGVQAVAAAAEQPFDLILMDLEMPEMDGYEATKRIKASGTRVPIIASTAHNADAVAESLREAGFDGMVSKPIERQALIEACAGYMSAHSR